MATCQYWVKSKQRFCKFAVVSGDHCPIHATGSGDTERIPCPLDPRHSIYKKHEAAHLSKCSLASQNLFETSQPCLNLGCNTTKTIPEASSVECADVADWKAFLSGIRSRLCEQLGREFCMDDSEIFRPTPWSDSVEKCAHAMTGHGFSSREEIDKHNFQNASLMQLLPDCGKDQVFAELGCGKAGLTRWLMTEYPEAAFVLLDVEARRHKQENKRDLEVDRDAVVRLRLDIRDFDLSEFLSPITTVPTSAKEPDAKMGSIEWRIAQLQAKVARLRSRPNWPPSHLVGVAKHLCGAATDWGLRCLTQPKSGELSIFFATCCHHKCQWDQLVGKRILQDHGVDVNIFQAMLGMAGWATTAGVPEEKRVLGRLVKSVIDLSRLVWLTKTVPNIESAQYLKYIEESVTPENFAICLTAKSCKKSRPS